MPGQKSIRLAKKGSSSSFAKRGLLRFVAKPSLSPASLCGNKEGGKWEGLIPDLFVFSACSFARATRRPVRSTGEIEDDLLGKNKVGWHNSL